MHFVSLLLIVGFVFQTPAEILLNSGYDKYMNDNYKGAIKDYDKAIALDPENEEIYYLRGVAKSNLGEKGSAMNDFNLALKLDPEYAMVYYEKAYIYLQDQNPEKAIEELDKVIQMKPDMAAAYVSRGTAKCMIEDVDGANTDWDRARILGIDYAELMTCE